MIYRSTPEMSDHGKGQPPCENPPCPGQLIDLPDGDGNLLRPCAFETASAVTVVGRPMAGGEAPIRKLVAVSFRTPCPRPECADRPDECNHPEAFMTVFLSADATGDLIWAAVKAYLFACWDIGIEAARGVRSLAGKLLGFEARRLKERVETLEATAREVERRVWMTPDDQGEANRVTAVSICGYGGGKEPQAVLDKCGVQLEAKTRGGDIRTVTLGLTWGNARWLAENLRTAVEARRASAEGN